MLSNLLFERKFLFSLWLVAFLFGLFWSAFMPPETAILFFNDYYSPVTNNLFIGLTNLGELTGFFIALTFVVVKWKIREVIGFIASALTMLLFVWLFKHIIYHDAIRPIVYLEKLGLILPNQSSVTLNRQFSFPSGHTSAAFTFFFYVGLCSEDKRVMLSSFLIAFLVGVSRVYLAQHFVVDVMAGSLLGVLISTVSYLFFVVRTPWSPSFLDKPIISKR